MTTHYRLFNENIIFDDKDKNKNKNKENNNKINNQKEHSIIIIIIITGNPRNKISSEYLLFKKYFSTTIQVLKCFSGSLMIPFPLSML